MTRPGIEPSLSALMPDRSQARRATKINRALSSAANNQGLIGRPSEVKRQLVPDAKTVEKKQFFFQKSPTHLF